MTLIDLIDMWGKTPTAEGQEALHGLLAQFLEGRLTSTAISSFHPPRFCEQRELVRKFYTNSVQRPLAGA